MLQIKLQIVRWTSYALNKIYKLTGSQKVFFYPMDPEFIQNPYPVYKVLRDTQPFFKSPLGFWVCSKHQDIQDILKNPKFGHLFEDRMIKSHGSDAMQDPSISMLNLWVALNNPPHHTRLRKVMNSSFSPRVVKKMDNHVEEITQELLNNLRANTNIDLLRDFAKPLPVRVICRILGIPEKDYDWFTYEAKLPARLIDPTPMSKKEREHINQCVNTLNEYFESFIEYKQQNPAEDLGTNMVKAYTEGEWSKEELLANLQILFGGGHDTTMNAIASGVYTLLKNPKELEKLKKDPTLINSCVEEILRYESSFQLASRTALEELEINDQKIQPGEVVLLLLGGANRDPNVFNNPESFDISREPNKHLAFGAGIHFCIGAMLSRIEAQTAIRMLFEQFPDMQLDETSKTTWKNMATLRGLTRLPVKLNR